MNNSCFIISGTGILDEKGRLTPDCDVYIANGKIEHIFPKSSLPGVPQVSPSDHHPEASINREKYRTINGSNCYLTPGLVNLHTHSPMNIFKGIAEDVDVETWFLRDIWPYESQMEQEDIATGAKLAVAEMIRCGVTAYADHYFSAGTICRAAAHSGLRLDMAPTLFGMSGDYPLQLDETRSIYETWNGYDGRIAIRVGPHSPYTCSPDQLREAAGLASSLGVGMHLHVSESLDQVEKSIAEYGMTPFKMIESCGLLEHPLIVGHGVFIRESDRPILAGKQAYMAICPKTYLKLGTGIGNVLENSVELPLAIGTDGAASSNTLNPLEQARLLALIGKADAGDGSAWSAEYIWSILMNGHNALPFRTGTIGEGNPADLVLWDLADIATAPLYNPLASLLYSAEPAHARFVWVAGKLVKDEGVVCMDTEAIVAEAEDRIRRLLARGRGESTLSL